ncbi:MAG: divalent-cation tolerance protein CutA [Candidatus Omnitrophica bacterium]|nr:divalent-cation tolerance protein CutA [Candidatus Omnitrophota bacterium]MDD4981204.1 divalent-cation tolerance protein CutA [Candidatus Omnitrophota bacterium]
MYSLVLVTAPDKKDARKIANALIKNKLAACVNIVGKVESLFWWQGKVDKANEVLLIIKSKKSLVPMLVKLVKSMHSYKVPEIISLSITSGFKPYLNWIDESLR